MPETPHHYDADAMHNVETKHEKSDVSVRGLLWFIVIFIAFAVVVHVLLYLLFEFYRNQFQHEPHPPRTAVAMPAGQNVPQLPRLQPFPLKDQRGEYVAPNASTPPVDMSEMRAREDQVLNNPGWIDRQKGIVSIPIENAKQIVLQRGMLQVNPAGAVAPTAPLPAGTPSAPRTPPAAMQNGESNAARIDTRPPQ